MGIGEKYFHKLFGKIKINKQYGSASNGTFFKGNIEISFESLGKKLDISQDALDSQVWNDIKKYMPINTGMLIAETDILNSSINGEVYLYPPESDYGHYLYEGEKYIDPEYKIAAFHNPNYGYWSRPGIEKIPSGEPIFYSSPLAESHWDEVAYQNHIKEWVMVAKQSMGE